MTLSLSERQEGYESDFDYKILNRIPVIIRCTIKNYKRLTQRVCKPFCEELSEVASQTMLYTITDIPDAIFGYQQNEEIIFVLRNDITNDSIPWYNNDIQKISSTVSSLVTLGFYKSLTLFGDNLDLVGDAIFNVKVFATPSVIEAFNNIMWRQSLCMKNAINTASFFEISEKLGKGPASELLKDKTYKEKADLLLQHCGKDLVEDYPTSFLRGIGVYKIPVVISTKNGPVKRNKWYIDNSLPNFIEENDFILNILNTGLDIYRGPDILDKGEYE